MFPFPSFHRQTEAAARLLRQAGRGVRPSVAQKARVKRAVEQRIGSHPALARAAAGMMPAPGTQERVWRQVRSRIRPLPVSSLLNAVRDVLSPSRGVRETVWARVLSRLRAGGGHVHVYARVKWAAAVAVVLALTTLSSPVFLLPSTTAESRVVLKGREVSLLGTGDGLWMPVPNQEIVLRQSAFIRTGNAAARLIVHDDMVIRLEPQTTIALHDLADRPADPQYPVTFTLHRGTAWVQGWVVPESRPILMRVNDTEVSLSEGSVRVTDTGTVQVWNRHATVARAGERYLLLAGEEFRPGMSGRGGVRTIAEREYDREDVKRNLSQDAVHRREIAQMQQERRAAQAGILPGSLLYPAKRVAEAVDSAFAFSEEARTKKLLERADTRLSEAAALIAQGSPAADVLMEYQQTILAAATESETSQALVAQGIASAKADLAATLPGDTSYTLKTTVLAAASQLPSTDAPRLQQELLADRMQAVKHDVEEGRIADVQGELQALAPRLAAASTDEPALRDVIASLSVTATAFDAPEVPVLADATSSAPVASSSSSARSARERVPTKADISREDPAMVVGDALGLLQKFRPDSQTLICSQSVAILHRLWGTSGNAHPDREAIAGRIIRDGPQPYAGIFRGVYLRWNAGEKINCNPEQPVERVF